MDQDRLYVGLLAEDGPVEWLTVMAIFAVGLFAALATRRIWRWRPRRPALLLSGLALVAFCLWAVLEEINYGQRLVGWDSPAFFAEQSDQSETNLHNVAQPYLKEHSWPIYKTRHFVGLAMAVYGLALPLALYLLGRRPRPGSVGDLLIPALYLVSGFALGVFLMLSDWPTGREEEIGELFIATCLMVVAIRVWRVVVPSHFTSEQSRLGLRQLATSGSPSRAQRRGRPKGPAGGPVGAVENSD